MSPLQKILQDTGQDHRIFRVKCAKLGDKEISHMESVIGTWYCTNCKSDCGLCSGAAMNSHKEVVKYGF